MKFAVTCLTVLFVAVLLASALPAAQRVTLYDTTECRRDWKKNQMALDAQLRFFVEGANGANDPLYVNFRIRLKTEAPPRCGEVETFTVQGQVTTGGTGSFHYVRISIEPTVAYYKYPTIGGTVSVASTYGYASGEMTHEGRVVVGAPSTVEDASVHYTTPAAPFVLQWRDFAFDECGQAPTAYQFAVYRQRLFASSKLVAKGVVDHVAGDTQTVSVEQNGPYTEGADEWFKDGSTYVVTLRTKRTGTEWYADDFGNAFIGRFTWKNNQADREVLAPCKPTAGDGRSGVRERVFERLHGVR